MTGQDIVNAARVYLGVRWLHQGRSPAGLDCIGLVLRVAQDLGLPCPDVVADYGRTPHGQRLMQGLAQYLQRVPVDEAMPGDVLLMQIEALPHHVAIFTDAGIIHAAAGFRRVVEHGFDEVWKNRTISAWRWPGVTNG